MASGHSTTGIVRHPFEVEQEENMTKDKGLGLGLQRTSWGQKSNWLIVVCLFVFPVLCMQFILPNKWEVKIILTVAKVQCNVHFSTRIKTYDTKLVNQTFLVQMFVVNIRIVIQNTKIVNMVKITILISV